MKCPACKGPLREKSAGNLVVDICYGGCGGIWFDARELEKIDTRSAATMHTVWRDPNKPVVLTDPRPCPRCSGQVLERHGFGEEGIVKVDQCPTCQGLWLDEGEFSQIARLLKDTKTPPTGWAAAIARAVGSL